MQTNKERIYEFIRLYQSSNEGKEVTTNYLAKTLDIQRTNVSTALGQLVKEGMLKKTNTRPVFYSLVISQEETKDAFMDLVGYNGSLKHAVQLARAAVIYPPKGLNTLLIGGKGTGKNLFARVMYQAAIEQKILKKDGVFEKYSCAEYSGNDEAALTGIFGEEEEAGGFTIGNSNVLFLENIHMLSARVRRKILEYLSQIENQGREGSLPMIIASCDENSYDVITTFEKYMPISIRLPSLSQRPLTERFALIKQFISLEAARTKRTIQAESELLDCLMLFDCEKNLWTLKTFIKEACMNAYLREYGDNKGDLHLYISDFDPVVRKGFLNYRLHREELEKIISRNVSYSFGGGIVEMNKMDQVKLGKGTIYEDLDRRIQDYTAKGFGMREIQTILSVDLETMFHRYNSQLTKGVVNREQLSKLVSLPLIDMTENFLKKAEPALGVRLPANTLYGLCLQLDETIKGVKTSLNMKADYITQIICENKTAYALALEFAKELEETFHIPFQLEETAIITLFLSWQDPRQKERSEPVLLFAFHGQGIGKAIESTIEGTLKNNNTYSVDIPFEQEDGETYEKLKNIVMDKDQGKGVLAVYDLESLRQMFYTISMETGIEVRTVSLPLTRMGMNWSRRAAITSNLDMVYKTAADELHTLGADMKKIIVTLCTTSEGLAVRIKEYLEQHNAVPDTDIIPLSLSDHNLLREKLLLIMEEGVIQCIVGTYDPELLAIPFVPVSEVLAAPFDKLTDVLMGQKTESRKVDMDEMFQYLSEHLEYVNAQKMQDMLKEIVYKISAKYHLNFDTEIGLLMHIACAVNRMAGKGVTPGNPKREQIIHQYIQEYRYLRRMLRKIEQKFHIIFPDDEFANIITIIERL